MIIFKEAAALTRYVFRQKDKQKKVGFVPTMGALHKGHISLIKSSTAQTDITISSIFVNPTQFNDAKDYDKYPVTVSHDVFMLQQAGCDVLFLPSVTEMYPAGLVSPIYYNLGELESVLEGKFRPNHFQGVCQVVHRLLDIVKPDILFLGQKDYQQYLVLKRLIKLLGMPVDVVTGSTFREPTGLAMSSRNTRLSITERERATAIFEMLTYIRNNLEASDIEQLEKHASNYLLSRGFSKVDYVSIADAETLAPVEVAGTRKLIILVAAYIGDVRLIDNMLLN